MAKGQNCKGIQTPKYNGPELVAVLRVKEMQDGKVGPIEVEKNVIVRGRLNNPRKNEQKVLTEICAKVKANNPTARLVSFERKEGQA